MARKCAKCGVTSEEDSSLTFHRFPQPSVHGSLRAKVWAMFCFPNGDWTSDQSLITLNKQHKMLCSKHFDDSSFTSDDRKRLNKYAIPSEACNILAKLRKEQLQLSTETQMVSDVSASTSQSVKHIDEYKPESHKLTKESPKRKSVLDEMGVKTVAELTPRKQKLYKRCRRNLTEILRLRKKFKMVKKQDRNVISCLQSHSAVNEIIKSKLSSSFYLFLQSQLQNTTRKLVGRRWTLDDKVLALSIYKKSSSCYRLLRRLFCLPSIGSLKVLLNKIPMRCGINQQLLDTIKDMTEKRSDTENLCTLSFDEMSIRKNLNYNSKLDVIEGYQDHAGLGRSKEIACKAITFMAIGVRKNWKQPIAFYFSGPYVTADRLAVIIKEVLSACFAAGLIVIGTVCDCDGVNLRALNSLGSSTSDPFFKHEGHNIITILDPPHLLKCFRNNFMKHDVEFMQEIQIDGQKRRGVAKWAHLEQFFNIDQCNPNFVFAPGMTKQHLNPNGKQKMKVKLAAQILSHSVAAGLFAKVAENELPQEATATATVVSKMDSLFDAMNGDTPDRKRGKPFLTNMSSTSPHLKLFSEMKFFFNEMKFLGARSKPPSQDGWLRTITAFERLYIELKKYGITTVSLRRFNQDPLENCFGCIRSNCGSNPNPTTVQFIAALKTSLITDLINNNKNRNCLDDDNNLLSNFKVFLTKGRPQIGEEAGCSTVRNEDEYLRQIEELDIPQCSGEIQACAYVCGFMVKNLDINCQACKNMFLADRNTELCHLFTSFKEYNDETQSLKYIQPSFCQFVENAATIINEYLKKESDTQGIKLNLRIILNKLDCDWLNGCEEHKSINKYKIFENTMAICLKRFCTLKNREFIEEASKQSLYRKIQTLKNV